MADNLGNVIILAIAGLAAFLFVQSRSGTTPIIPETPFIPGVQPIPDDIIPVTPVPVDPGNSLPGDICGMENPVGSGCYPYATGSLCNVNCNTRCTDFYGNYKPCDPAGTPIEPNPYACAPGVPVSTEGYYPDIFGNLMKDCIEVCHRGDVTCAHNLPASAGNWRYVYD